MTTPAPPPLSYADAGVDIDRGNALVERIKPMAARTRRPGQLGGLGGFGALFTLKGSRYKDPVLVSTTDGVGTKLKLAIALDRHEGIGIDLVGMCVNDLVVQGAEPLFFLDYFATGQLDVDIAARVIDGIARGCEQAGCALVGGETAEMPGVYAPGDYDLAGFCVGAVEADELIDGSRVKPGDVLIGLASSGPHSNGYSLIRRVLDRTGVDLGTPMGTATLGDALLTPTRIYVKPLLSLLASVPVHAMAHITGGGLVENPPRVLPPGTRAVMDVTAWKRPPVFDWLRDEGHIEEREMLRTFNCGIGMLIVTDADAVPAALRSLEEAGEQAFVVGSIARHEGPPEVTFEGL